MDKFRNVLLGTLSPPIASQMRDFRNSLPTVTEILFSRQGKGVLGLKSTEKPKKAQKTTKIDVSFSQLRMTETNTMPLIMEDKINLLLDEIKSVKNNLEELKKLKATIESIPSRMNSIEEVFKLRTNYEENRHTTEGLKEKIAKVEQYSRVNKLIINNIPSMKNENTRELDRAVADNFKINVDDC